MESVSGGPRRGGVPALLRGPAAWGSLVSAPRASPWLKWVSLGEGD